MLDLSKQNIFLGIYAIFALILIMVGLSTDIKNNPSMSLHDLLGIILSSIISILGVFFIILQIKEKYFMFILSIISCILSIYYLCVYSPLIWDISITVFYFIVTIYGIVIWRQKKTEINCSRYESYTPKRLSIKQIYYYLILGIIGTGILFYIGYSIGKYSSPQQAAIDSATTILALLAWWFTSKKYIASWYLWILVNILSTPLYISIGSYTLSMMYFGYIAISIYGLKSWENTIKQARSNFSTAND